MPDAVASTSALPDPALASSKSKRKPKPWVHFAAGGAGGMMGAILTAPFDLVKTRLQSDLYQKDNPLYAANKGKGVKQSNTVKRLLYNFVETGQILKDTYTKEGPTALFKGLGPTLVGAIPARSIIFYTYGNGKTFYTKHLTSDGQETAAVHLLSAATAGVATATATNPIWVVKTRIQLESSQIPSSSKASKARVLPPKFSRSYIPSVPTISTTSTIHTSTAFRSSLVCISQIYATQGIAGFYKGLSASYLGVTEGVIQWTLYEQVKKMAARRSGLLKDEGWGGKTLAAGSAKLVATLLTYPHEVIRTRLRQTPPLGQAAKYTGLVQAFNLIVKEDGVAALYSGLSPHLLRVVPNAIALYLTYEGFLKLATRSTAGSVVVES